MINALLLSVFCMSWVRLSTCLSCLLAIFVCISFAAHSICLSVRLFLLSACLFLCQSIVRLYLRLFLLCSSSSLLSISLPPHVCKQSMCSPCVYYSVSINLSLSVCHNVQLSAILYCPTVLNPVWLSFYVLCLIVYTPISACIKARIHVFLPTCYFICLYNICLSDHYIHFICNYSVQQNTINSSESRLMIYLIIDNS